MASICALSAFIEPPENHGTDMLSSAALLVTAILLGGIPLLNLCFAPVLFKQLPMEQVRPLLRGTFPYYYAAVIAVGALATALALPINVTAAVILAVITLSTVYARQILMLQINAAADAENKKAFGRLHGLSVVIQLIQRGLCARAARTCPRRHSGSISPSARRA